MDSQKVKYDNNKKHVCMTHFAKPGDLLSKRKIGRSGRKTGDSRRKRETWTLCTCQISHGDSRVARRRTQKACVLQLYMYVQERCKPPWGSGDAALGSSPFSLVFASINTPWKHHWILYRSIEICTNIFTLWETFNDYNSAYNLKLELN